MVKIGIKKIPTTQDICNRCCFEENEIGCDKHITKCRFKENGVKYFFTYTLPENFKDMKSVPKNASSFIGIDANGNIYKSVHYACDRSGEWQPPFEGFFDDKHHEICNELIGWKMK